jgi:hypothetical protein
MLIVEYVKLRHYFPKKNFEASTIEGSRVHETYQAWDIIQGTVWEEHKPSFSVLR